MPKSVTARNKRMKITVNNKETIIIIKNNNNNNNNNVLLLLFYSFKKNWKQI